MTDKDLRKLSRTELLELLIELSKENGILKDEISERDGRIAELEERLKDRSLLLENAGSIAEASLQLIMGVWSTESNELVAYAALMAAARNERTTTEVAFIAVEKALRANPASMRIANGVVALLCYVATKDKSVKVGIPVLMERVADSPIKEYIKEELTWRMDFL